MLGRIARMRRRSSDLHCGERRAQSGIDFIISYGFALLVIAIAIFVMLKSNLLSSGVTPDTCYPAQPFLCISDILFSNGTMYVVFAQATGGTMNVIGIACATSTNSLGDYPAYGNTNVLGYSALPSAYPANTLANGMTIYSDNASRIVPVYCYGAQGVIHAPKGTAYGGYIWINYTLTNVPGYRESMLASFTAKTV
jgi:hypothetical protein